MEAFSLNNKNRLSVIDFKDKLEDNLLNLVTIFVYRVKFSKLLSIVIK
jgi:hypothetical protein